MRQPRECQKALKTASAALSKTKKKRIYAGPKVEEKTLAVAKKQIFLMSCDILNVFFDLINILKAL